MGKYLWEVWKNNVRTKEVGTITIRFIRQNTKKFEMEKLVVPNILFTIQKYLQKKNPKNRFHIAY